MNTKHTPTPWQVVSGSIYESKSNEGLDCTRIAVMDRTNFKIPPVMRDANAAFIVRAVNAHDALVGALEPIASWNLKSEMSGIGKDHTDKDALLDTAIRLARTALKLAKEGE